MNYITLSLLLLLLPGSILALAGNRIGLTRRTAAVGLGGLTTCVPGVGNNNTQIGV